MRKISIILIFLSITLTSFTQDRKITVQVLDSETKKPVKNATATIYETTTGTVANVMGFFELNLKESQDTIVISSIGYSTVQIKAPEVNQFKISLNREHLILNTLDLSSINLIDTLSTIEIQKGNEINSVYPKGWKLFYVNLGKELMADTVLAANDSIEVKFTIASTGYVINLSCEPSDKTDFLKSAFENLGPFLPAEQNGLSVEQHFILPIAVKKLPQRFTVVEEPSEPIGGIAGFYKFINKNLRYPKQARMMGVEGKVMMEFIVNRDGSLSDIKVFKELEQGAMRRLHD
jgi:hypothetical protein